MTENTSLKIAIVGVDGSGKSSCFRDVLRKLTKRRIASVGDEVLISENGSVIRPEINYLKIKSFLGEKAKHTRGKTTYKLMKLGDLIFRAKIQDEIEAKYRPEIILTDGSPLINALGWGGLYHPDFYNRENGKVIMEYLNGTEIPLAKKLFYLKHLPEVFLINKLKIRFQTSNIVFFLKVSPENAIKRIKKRGEKKQRHETVEFLASLQDAYELVCSILPKETKIFRINTDNKNLSWVTKTITEKINENN